MDLQESAPPEVSDYTTTEEVVEEESATFSIIPEDMLVSRQMDDAEIKEKLEEYMKGEKCNEILEEMRNVEVEATSVVAMFPVAKFIEILVTKDSGLEPMVPKSQLFRLLKVTTNEDISLLFSYVFPPQRASISSAKKVRVRKSEPSSAAGSTVSSSVGSIVESTPSLTVGSTVGSGVSSSSPNLSSRSESSTGGGISSPTPKAVSATPPARRRLDGGSATMRSMDKRRSKKIDAPPKEEDSGKEKSSSKDESKEGEKPKEKRPTKKGLDGGSSLKTIRSKDKDSKTRSMDRNSEAHKSLDKELDKAKSMNKNSEGHRSKEKELTAESTDKKADRPKILRRGESRDRDMSKTIRSKDKTRSKTKDESAEKEGSGTLRRHREKDSSKAGDKDESAEKEGTGTLKRHREKDSSKTGDKDDHKSSEKKIRETKHKSDDKENKDVDKKPVSSLPTRSTSKSSDEVKMSKTVSKENRDRESARSSEDMKASIKAVAKDTPAKETKEEVKSVPIIEAVVVEVKIEKTSPTHWENCMELLLNLLQEYCLDGHEYNVEPIAPMIDAILNDVHKWMNVLEFGDAQGKENRQPGLNLWKLKVIELFILLIELRIEKVDQKLIEINLWECTWRTFIKNDRNNIMQALLTTLWDCWLSDRDSLVDCAIKNDFVNKLMDEVKKGSKLPMGKRPSYIGHLVEFCNTIIKKGSDYPKIQEHVNSTAGWDDFVKGELDHEIKLGIWPYEKPFRPAGTRVLVG
eukprot:TRINITY_DN1256_c0_g1_i2.p1 TRINITY_DN1256_c0_g1~~TRINITY_DN1256_c0_g1_i2.p1  ORF type:complete len:746 (-),score=157.59 TRINITY_DN1256_c0_g1_i2:82-2319(-)